MFWLYFWKLSRLSRKFPDCPETFQTVRKLSRLSRNFPDVYNVLTWFLETFQTLRKISGLSGNFQTVRKNSRQSGNFPDCPETFQTVQKLSIQSENFPDSPETFQTIWKLSRLSGNFPDCPETFQTYTMFWLDFSVNFVDTRKNFPDAQKLSGRQCRRADGVFLPLARTTGRLAGRRFSLQLKREGGEEGRDLG